MSIINKIINVNAFYFSSGKSMKLFPRKIELDYNQITFIDGIQYLVKKGSEYVNFYDMNDGKKIYRLKQENNIWVLIGAR